MWDIDFILGVGKLISLVLCMVFIEGVVASRPNGKWTGLLLPVIMVMLSIWVFLTWKNFTYFILVFCPALLCCFIFYICRRSIKNGTALSLNQDEES
ncbi:hypothetical protein CLNEO_02420 [Anaerotignum neopropionicum]|uniref:Uncharacterized protein n=1 Tax=Anaerotignum neopropionicum TaxID=36847 RepID=A0A136WI64_9FIRM|nr:hypothetical protein [Anaerotignum neopropionicum]KXL54144.1 hypothetical protein CLNEO_02420 [Anaerotignum neopropionicum]